MEDAATAEISRAQLWQWVHHHASITEGPSAGTPITAALVNQTIADSLAETRPKVDDARYSAYERAATLMRALIESPTFPAFLTVPAYTEVLTTEKF
jgi:malate synthase